MGEYRNRVVEEIIVEDRTRSAFAGISRSFKNAEAVAAATRKEIDRFGRAGQRVAADPSWKNIDRQLWMIGQSARRIGDLTGLSAGLRAASNAAGGLATKVREIAVGYGKWALVAGGAAGVAGIKESMEAFSNYNEMRSKFDVVFGEESAKAIQWVEQMGQAMGRSDRQMIEFMSTLQDTFVPLGFSRQAAAGLSKEVTKLAVDMASFNNQLDADTLRDLQSALIGNHETVRKYGVIITDATLGQELLNMGIEGGTQKASEQAKMMARLNLIFGSTKDAQGDAIRTADSWANRMKWAGAMTENFAKKLGQLLEPAFKPIIQQYGEWIKNNDDLLAQDIAGYVVKAVEVAKEFAQTLLAITKGVIDFASEHPTLTKMTAGFVALNALGLVPSLQTLKGIVENGPAIKDLILNLPTLMQAAGGVGYGGMMAGGGAVRGALMGPWGMTAGTALGVGAAAYGGWEVGSAIRRQWFPTGEDSKAAGTDRLNAAMPLLREQMAAGAAERAKQQSAITDQSNQQEQAKKEAMQKQLEFAQSQTNELKKQTEELEKQRKKFSEQLGLMDPIKRAQTMNMARYLQGATAEQLASLSGNETARSLIGGSDMLGRIFQERAKMTGYGQQFEQFAGGFGQTETALAKAAKESGDVWAMSMKDVMVDLFTMVAEKGSQTLAGDRQLQAAAVKMAGVI